MTYKGDQAFTRSGLTGTRHELEFAGATSLFRRSYAKITEGVDAVILGVPFDIATTYRPGARLGPRMIRAASASITHGRVWPWGFNPFDDLAVVDWGDVMFDEGSRESMCEEVQSAVAALATGCIPLILGGDHYSSLPVLRALCSKRGPISLLHFDAHSDTWVDERHHHGSVFYHALREGIVNPETSIQVGLRTFNQDDHGLVCLTTPWIYQFGEAAAAREISRILRGPVYVSLDVDVLDPAFAPGTGTPAPGGLSTYQLKQLIYGLAEFDIDVVGVDVVEVSPPYDVSEITSLAAASCLLDLICLIAAGGRESARPDDLQGGSGRQLWLR